jgi:neopullulanase
MDHRGHRVFLHFAILCLHEISFPVLPMKMRFTSLFCLLAFSLISFNLRTQPAVNIERIEPSFWWCGMEYNKIQLLVYGKGISDCEVKSLSKDIRIEGIQKVTNPNYLFVNLVINLKARSGFYPLIFMNNQVEFFNYSFELKQRNSSGKCWQGFNSSDAIYLLMPDRFANGDTSNDTSVGMLEKSERSNPHGRHGGDIAGIESHLKYIYELGFTSVWTNPLLENNMPEYSYHGYGITDFYRIDPRFGSNIDYVKLVDAAHDEGLKIIMDMVMNHCGTNHWFYHDTPSSDWFNQWESMTYSNFRGEAIIDPYASEYDKNLMEKGWFAPTLADLNLRNPLVLKYLIQNTIWWIEYSGIDGIRMDTYPYPNKNAMGQWAKTIKEIYPTLTIVGETWLQKTAHTAYWQSGTHNFDGYDSNIPVVTDFPLYYAIGQSMNERESWTEGLRRLYYVLTEDFLYGNPNDLLIFPDNHDLERYYTTIKEDLNSYKLGLAFLLTTRGIPQIYYGTELLMTGEKKLDDGYIRCDFPGGWPGDGINGFTGKGTSQQQKEASEYLRKLLEWRKTCEAVHNGKILHFIPENNTYVYFRYTDKQTVMVVLNKNAEELTLTTQRFREGLGGCSSAKNILTGETITDLETIKVPAMSPMILELIK